MTNARNSFVFSKRDTKSWTQIWYDAAPPTCWCVTACHSRCALEMMLGRRCATARRSRCTRDCACCVPARLLLLRICQCTQRDLKWLQVRCWGPCCIPLLLLQPMQCRLGQQTHQVRRLQYAVVQRCLLPQWWRQRRQVIQVRHGRVWVHITRWYFK